MNRTVLFLDGTTARKQIHIYGGACRIGQATAYVVRHGKRVWVKPGESVEFVEAAE